MSRSQADLQAHSQAVSSAVHYLQHVADAGTGKVVGLAGCWKLGHGSALTLLVGQAGKLRIAHGRVWITFDDAARDPVVRAGDHFLEAGESMELAAGRSLVMESFAVGQATAAYFTWEPVVQPSGAAQLFRDLCVAMGLAGSAATRLVRGVASGLMGGARA